MQTKEHRRGRLLEACPPWPRGQVLTTDPSRIDNAPDGPEPVYVDRARYAHMLAAGRLGDAEDDRGEWTRPDSPEGDPEPEPSVTFHVYRPPPPVPPGDRRLDEGGDR